MDTSGLTIDRKYTTGFSTDHIRDLLAQKLKSTDFALCESSGNVRLLGARGDHLRVDPELHTICAAAGLPVPDGGPGYHASNGSIDFCLEDGLSGLFMSRAIFGAPQDDWIIVHLDDHRDMMPTLLAKSNTDGLYDPETGGVFDAHTEQDWHTALMRGTLTIGNYLVPLFHDKPSEMRIHVRHLRPQLNAHDQTHLFHLNAATETYQALGATQFAAVALDITSQDAAGSFLQNDCCDKVLLDFPSGRVIVHIDLDFFVNDFNGNPVQHPQELGAQARASILKKMDEVFSQISGLDRPIERWIIATSPGFCAARHWAWLLDALDERICALTGDERHVFLG
jgi:hypothetical protein